jgi:hypothetical protein
VSQFARTLSYPQNDITIAPRSPDLVLTIPSQIQILKTPNNISFENLMAITLLLLDDNKTEQLGTG